MPMMNDMFSRPIVSTSDQVMRQAKQPMLNTPWTQGADEQGAAPAALPLPPAPPSMASYNTNSGDVVAEQPGTTQTSSAAAVTPSAPVFRAAPSVAVPTATAGGDGGRGMLREMALALIKFGSPAQRAQGMQMLFEANQATPAEKEAAERKRLAAEVDNADVAPEAKARAKVLIGLGAKPDKLAETLGFDQTGLAEAQKRKELLSKTLMQQSSAAMTGAIMQKSAEQAIELIDSGTATTGTKGWAASWVPGSDASRLENAIATLRANIGFDRLQQMREDSKTGGALGNVSNIELHFLQATQGSLDISQDKETLKRNIKDVVKGRQLLNEMRGLIPGLEMGDPASVKRYTELNAQIAEIGAGVSQRHAGVQVPASTGKGAEIDAKYGVR